MLVTFSFDPFSEITQQEIEVLRPHIRGDFEIEAHDPESKTRYHHYRDYVADLSTILGLVPRLTKFIKLQNAELTPTGFEYMMAQFKTLTEKIDTLAGRNAGDRMYNDRVNVHVPGLGLLLIDRVILLEDACTDNLQRHLDRGWRIITVCPQPDQRRSDYVLGRTGDENA